ALVPYPYFLLMGCLLPAFHIFITGVCVLQRLISEETVGGEGGIQIVVSNGRPAPFLKIEAVAGADLELGSFAQQQGALRTLFINQLDLAVTTQHRGADTGADPFHHFVPASGGGVPQAYTKHQRSGKNESTQHQKNAVRGDSEDNKADCYAGDPGQECQQDLAPQDKGKLTPLVFHVLILSKIICWRRY